MSKRSERKLLLTLCAIASSLAIIIVALSFFPENWPQWSRSSKLNDSHPAEQSRSQAERFALIRALAEDPRNVDLRWQLAQLYLRIGDGAAAAVHIDRVYAERRTDELELAKLHALMLQARYRDAVTLATELESRIDDPAIYLFRAQAQRQLDQTASAKDDFEHVLSLDPENVEALVGLARIGILEFDYEGVEAHIDAVLAVSPTHLEAWFARGDLNLQRSQFEAALAAFEHALHIDPSATYAQVGLARVLLNSGDPQGAQERLATIGEAYDEDPNILYLRGAAAVENGDLEVAKGYFADVLNIVPRDFYSLRHLGVIYHKLQEFGLAERRLMHAAAIQPDDFQVSMALAKTWRAMQKFDRSIEILQTLTRSHAQSPELYYEIGLTYEAQGRAADADRALHRALEIKPDLLRAQLAVGRRLLAAGDTNAALQMAQQLQSTRLGSADGHALEGDVWLALDDAIQAAEAYEEALQTSPKATFAVALAAAHRARGDTTAATAVLDEWLRSHGDDPVTYMALAEYEQKHANIEAAIAAYEHVLNYDFDNSAALLSLADLYQGSDLGRAREFARRALEAAPYDPLVLESNGWLLVEAGAVQQGLRMLNRAYLTRPERRRLRYRRAVALARAGSSDEAQAELTELLALDAADAIATQASDMLQDLREP